MLLLHAGACEARPDTVNEALVCAKAHPRSHTLSKHSLAGREEKHQYAAGAKKDQAEVSSEGDSKAAQHPSQSAQSASSCS